MRMRMRLKPRFSLLLTALLLLHGLCMPVSATETAPGTLPPPVYVAPGEEHLMHIKITPDGIQYSVKEDGTVKIEGCRTTAIRLEIPSEIDGMTVNEVAVGAFCGYSGLIGVVLPETIETIGARAFENCANLTSVTLPNGLRAIPERCFYGCLALQQVNLPEALTEVGIEAFYRCALIGKMTAPASLSAIGIDAFFGCEQLILDCKANAFAAEYAEANLIPQSFFQTTNAQLLLLLGVTVAMGIAFVLLRKPTVRLVGRVIGKQTRA